LKTILNLLKSENLKDEDEEEIIDYTTQSEELPIEIEIQKLHIKLNEVKIKYLEKLKSIQQDEIKQVKDKIAKL
jgi:hypothetical protein